MSDTEIKEAVEAGELHVHAAPGKSITVDPERKADGYHYGVMERMADDAWEFHGSIEGSYIPAYALRVIACSLDTLNGKEPEPILQ